MCPPPGSHRSTSALPSNGSRPESHRMPRHPSSLGMHPGMPGMWNGQLPVDMGGHPYDPRQVPFSGPGPGSAGEVIPNVWSRMPPSMPGIQRGPYAMAPPFSHYMDAMMRSQQLQPPHSGQQMPPVQQQMHPGQQMLPVQRQM